MLKRLILVISSLPFLLLEQGACHDYYQNYPDYPSLSLDSMSCERSVDTKNRIDVKTVSGGILINEKDLATIGPILLPSVWGEFDFYQSGTIRLIESVDSHLIYALQKEGIERYVFLINVIDKHLASVAVLSELIDASTCESSYYSHSYTIIDNHTINIYDNTQISDDVIVDTEPVTVPLFVRIRMWLLRAFSRNKQDYPSVLSVRLNQLGFLGETSQ